MAKRKQRKSMGRRLEKMGDRAGAFGKAGLAGLVGVGLVMLCVAGVVGCGRAENGAFAAEEQAERGAPLAEEGSVLSGEEPEESSILSGEGQAEKDAVRGEDSGDGADEGSGAALTGESGEERQAESLPEGYDIVLAFTGDICLDDTCAVMQDYIGQGEELENNIAPELLQKMREADVCVVNNEFAYSDRGAPLANKMYTFRADPGRVSMLQEMGVDIAGLANNHVYDYGPEAMEDTLDTLRQADIDYVGAGSNLAEAMAPLYREVHGKRIAFVAASRAEKYKLTPQATEDAAGILRCYDTALFLEEIRQAAAEADYVIALVHWGTEYSTELEEVQRTTGRDYIDAGADIVIGAHTHCLQGMEYYQGKPILYSLGNFWFNSKSLDTMLVQVRLSGTEGASEIDGDNVEVRIVPAKQEDCRTRMLSGADARGLFDYLEGLSVGVEIDEAGVVRKTAQEDGNAEK